MKTSYQEIEGWFDFEKIYQIQVDRVAKGHFVEIGSWRGKSSFYMADAIKNSGKKIKFDCIDTWKGIEGGVELSTVPKEYDVYIEFKENMEYVKDYYTAIIGSSHDLHKLYKNNSLDFVFIDGDHRYEAVVKDITNWLPKVKEGGTLAGHDFWSSSDVARAVRELLPDFKINGSCWIYDKIK